MLETLNQVQNMACWNVNIQRAQIFPCKEKFLEVGEAMKKIIFREITLREAAVQGSWSSRLQSIATEKLCH